MAPITIPGSNAPLFATQVIKEPGDFEHLGVPAKCAARIGQTFTDTSAWLEVQANATARQRDVINPETGRVFSDGRGTISKTLPEKVWDQYQKFFTRLKPIVLQVRHGGCKGGVSLDTRLGDSIIILRKSMWKFEARGTQHIEVCGMNDQPMPLYLNRPLIKILANLGVPETSILELQDEMVNNLQKPTSSATSAAKFLETEHVAKALGIPYLLKCMEKIGFDGLKVPFLS
jgi:RNA dependent RNA polymerase